MVCSLTWPVSFLLAADVEPLTLQQVIIKQIFIEISAFLLVASEEEQLAIKKDSFGARSWKRNLPSCWQEAPLVCVDVILKQIVLSIIIISASEQENAVFDLDAVMTCPRREVALAKTLDLPPLADAKVQEVF